MQVQKAEVQKVKPRPLPCYKSCGEDLRLSQEAVVKCRAQQTTVATPFKQRFLSKSQVPQPMAKKEPHNQRTCNQGQRVSLRSPDWVCTRDPFASASQVLEIQVHTTTSGWKGRKLLGHSSGLLGQAYTFLDWKCSCVLTWGMLRPQDLSSTPCCTQLDIKETWWRQPWQLTKQQLELN